LRLFVCHDAAGKEVYLLIWPPITVVPDFDPSWISTAIC
jgi:hypothetical protein